MNRTMLARAWAMGAGPDGGVVTIDPDANLVDTYGPGKEGSTFTYRGEVGLSPLIGVCGELVDLGRVGPATCWRSAPGAATPIRGGPTPGSSASAPPPSPLWCGSG